MTEKARTLGFRLGEVHRKTLEARAKKTGSTASELARELVIDGLDDDREIDQLRQKVTSVESQIKSLRQDLSVSVQALLVASGKVTAEQAKEWIQQNLEAK